MGAGFSMSVMGGLVSLELLLSLVPQVSWCNSALGATLLGVTGTSLELSANGALDAALVLGDISVSGITLARVLLLP